MKPIDRSIRRVYLTRVRDFVEGTRFPASRAEVIAFARGKNTPSAIMTDLTRLPVQSYNSLNEVVAAIDTVEFGAAR